MTNIMVDIETLDIKPSAVVLSIGAIEFDFKSKKLGEEFYGTFNEPSLDQQLYKGRTISGSTICWWMKQNEEARKVFDNKSINSNAEDILSRFSDYIRSFKGVVNLWGNGSDFDNVILISLYNSYSLNIPWNTFNNRCYRTVKNLYPSVNLERKGTYHNALDDAKCQAEHLIKIYESKL